MNVLRWRARERREEDKRRTRGGPEGTREGREEDEKRTTTGGREEKKRTRTTMDERSTMATTIDECEKYDGDNS